MPAKRSTQQEGDQATIIVSLFGGDRKPLSGNSVLLRVRDGNQRELIGRNFRQPTVNAKVPFYNNLGDLYTVLASCDRYRDAGFYPVKVNPDLEQPVDLMLVSNDAGYIFLDWDQISEAHPEVFNLLCCSGDEDQAKGHYEDLLKSKPPSLASLLNLGEAMRVIHLPVGTPLDYFREIEWDDSLAQDRFFAYADEQLLEQVRLAAQQGEFAPEPNPGLFHPDATSSYKQIQFGEANVQLTFHEKNKKRIKGTNCVMVEPDIDYYKDLGAHALLEVIPNTLSHGLTDPQMVYVLRWIAGRHAGMPEFEPAYTLTDDH